MSGVFLIFFHHGRPYAVSGYKYTIQILDGGESTIQFRGRRKAIMDEAFLSPVNCIVDELPSNICYIIHIGKILTMLL